MKIVSVVGTRPQFVKLGAISRAAKLFDLQHIIINTGQHYDPNMSDVFFDELKIPTPDYDLGIGSASHGVQTGAMMSALDPIISEINPDWVLVYGDTNSTLAATLSAVKMHIKVVHLEAGLRSFNREMPEEHNRVLTDHASDLLLAPTEIAMQHLQKEGLISRAILIGDVMTDICLLTRDSIKNFESVTKVSNPYVLATIHRAENTDDPIRLRNLVEKLQNSLISIHLLAHPRLIAKANEFNINLRAGALSVFDPVSYPEMVKLIMHSNGVVTDSGGLQKKRFYSESCVQH